MIEAINKVSKPVVAIDVPSGIDATSGRILGVAIKASRTVTMAFAKPGLFVYPARDFSGRVEVADIGMPARIFSKEDARFHLLTILCYFRREAEEKTRTKGLTATPS